MKNIFISSTFRDMHAERDLVQERVLPALREEARRYGDNVEAIDLRWGVDTSMLETDEGSAKVLTVCLDEIDRSHPYMLIFLGERYGWIPKGELIEKAVKSRRDKYVPNDFEKSVTALEIEYGALSEKYGDIKHCVVCFREPVTEDMDDEIKIIYTEQEEKGIWKLQELKERIREKLGSDGKFISYTGTWDESAQTLVDLRADGQPLEEVLTGCYIEMFQQDWKEYNQLSWQDKEQLFFQALAENKRRSFAGREWLLNEYYQKVVNGNGAFLLQGEAGSGKTAIMCKLAERLQKEGKKVFYFFSGTGNRSKCAYDFVQQMIFQVEKLLGIEENWEENITEEAQRLKNEGHYKRLSADFRTESGYEVCWNRTEKFAAKLQEKIYFFIDSLEQLERDKHAKELDFLIENEKIQMILSCSDEFTFSYENMEFIQRERVPLLEEEEIKAVAKSMLKSYSRDTYEELEQEMLKKKKIGNPLYISFLIQRLNMMGQEELEQLKTGDEIRNYILNIIRQLPEELDEAAAVILKTAVDKISPHSGDLQDALYFIAISRNGLRIRDLQKLLKNKTVVLGFLDIVTQKDWCKDDLHNLFQNKEEAFSALNFTLLIKYLDGFFYSSEFDKIDFAHKGIRLQLRKEIEKPCLYEEDLKIYIKRLGRHDELWKQEGMYFARITRDYEMAAEMITCLPVVDKMEEIISKEASEDQGEFFCEMMRKTMGKVIDKELLESMRYFTAGYNGEKLDMISKLNMTETRILCWEEMNKKCKTDWILSGLTASYEDMGSICIEQGRMEEAVSYLERSVYYAQRMYENYPQSILGLRKLCGSYSFMGSTLFKLGRMEEAVLYYKKAESSYEELYEREPEEWILKRMCNSYHSARTILMKLEKEEEAILHYEKEVYCKELMYEKAVDDNRLQELCLDYNKIGIELNKLNRLEEAVSYYKKAASCAEKLYERMANEKNIQQVYVVYRNVGHALKRLKRLNESLDYYGKAMHCKETLHGIPQDEQKLEDFVREYTNLGESFYKLERLEEALVYYEKSMKCKEALYEMKREEGKLFGLALSYESMGLVLRKLGRLEEALFYYKKEVSCCEILCEKKKNKMGLRKLLSGYRNQGDILSQLGRLTEALECRKKAVDIIQEICEDNPGENDVIRYIECLRELSDCLYQLGRGEEAEIYAKLASELEKRL